MEQYETELRELNTDPIANKVIKNNYGEEVDKIHDMIQFEYIKNTSYGLFNGDIVIVYPRIKEVKAKKHYDTVYGAYIGVNNPYISYNALFVNLTNGNKYVLKHPLRFEISDKIPRYIDELDELERTTEVDIPIKKVEKTLKLTKKW